MRVSSLRRQAWVRRFRLFAERLEIREAPSATQLLSDHRAALAAGVPQYLDEIGGLISARVLTNDIPLIGSGLATATGADFVQNVRSALKPKLDLFVAGQSPTVLQGLVFDALGPSAGGLNALADGNKSGTVTVADVLVSTDDATYVQFNMSLTQVITLAAADIDFEIGIPGLGLDVNGSVSVDLSYSWNLGFGVDLVGFYGDTLGGSDFKNPTTDIRVSVDATLSKDFQATGSFLAFDLTATDYTQGAIDQRTGAHFDYDLEYSNFLPTNIASAADFRYRPAPPSDLNATRLQVNDLKLSGKSLVHMPLKLSVAGNADFPSVDARLRIDLASFNYNITKDTGSVDFIPDKIQFNNVSLDMGAFLTRTIKPIAGYVGMAIDPLDFLIDRDPAGVDGDGLGLYYAPIPVLEKLPSFGSLGNLGTLQGIVQSLGNVQPQFKTVDSVLDLLSTISSIVKGINALSSTQGIMIDLGDFEIGLEADGKPTGGKSNRTRTPAKSPRDQFSEGGKTAGAKGDAEAASAVDKVSQKKRISGGGAATFTAGFDLPILDDPAPNVINLLVGSYANVNLVEFELTGSFDVDFGLNINAMDITQQIGNLSSAAQTAIEIFLSLIPVDITAYMKADLGASFNLKAGYDASGLARFVDTRDPGDLSSGFYIQSGKIVTLTGGLSLGAGITLSVPVVGGELFKAWASGGVGIGIDVNLNDPNNDNKLRVDEIAAITEADSLSGFAANISRIVSITGSANYNLDLGLRVLGVDDWGFRTQTGGKIFEFSVGGNPRTVLADGSFTDINGNKGKTAPKLATVRPDGTLYLNIGPKAGARGFGAITDGSESVTVDHVAGSTYKVTAFGASIEYTGVTAINAKAGAGDDTIIVNNAQVPVTISGGDGNDSIVVSTSAAATLNGDAGNDTLVGGGGHDTLTGGDGNDTITGGGGDDLLNGANGNDALNGGAGNDTLFGELGDDSMTGNSGIDALAGGSGADTIRADRQDTGARGDAGNDLFIYDESASLVPMLVTISNGSIREVSNSQTSVVPYFDFETRQILTGSNADTVSLAGSLVGSSTINTGVGNDSMTIGLIAADLSIITTGTTIVGNLSNTLDTIAAGLTVSGGQLVIRHDGSAKGSAPTLSATALTGITAKAIGFSNLKSLVLNLGNGRDTLALTGIGAATTITLGNGQDAVAVTNSNAFGGNVTIDGGLGNDALSVSFTNAPTTPTSGPRIVANAFEGATISTSAESAGSSWTLVDADVRVGGESAANTLLSTSAPLTMNLGGGADTVLFAAISRVVTLDTGGGNDSVRLGSATPIDTKTRVLGEIKAAVSLTTGAGTDSVTFNDVANADATTGELARFGARTRVQGLGLVLPVDVDAERVTVNLGAGTNLVKVNNPAAVFVLNTGSGNDTVEVSNLTAVSNSSTINLAGDADLFTAVNGSASYTLTGGNGSDTIQVYRSFESAPTMGAVTSADITGLIGAKITYSGWESLDLKLGTGNDTLSLDTAGSSLSASIDMGFGNDSVVVTSLGTGVMTVVDSPNRDTVRAVFADVPTTSMNDRLNFVAERLIVDHTAATTNRRWLIEDHKLLYRQSGNDTVVLDVTGAGEVELRGGKGTDTFSFTTDAASNSSVTINGNSATLVEGPQVLTPGNWLTGATLGTTVPLAALELPGNNGLAVTPDGRFAFVATEVHNSPTDRLFVLRRVDTKYVVQQILQGIVFQGVEISESIRSLTVSPDGKNLYATNFFQNAVTTYSIDSVYGNLTPIQVTKHIITPGVNRLFYPIDFALSPNGQSAYVLATASGDFANNTINHFTRDTATGLLTIQSVVENGVAGVTGLSSMFHITLNADATRLFGQSAGGMQQFTRNTSTGALSVQFSDVLPTRRSLDVNYGNVPLQVTVSSDGKFGYIVSGDRLIVAPSVNPSAYLYPVEVIQELRPSANNSLKRILLSPASNQPYLFVMASGRVAMYARNASTGRLTWVSDFDFGSGLFDITVSPDGQYLYCVTSAFDFFGNPVKGDLKVLSVGGAGLTLIQTLTNVSNFDPLLAMTPDGTRMVLSSRLASAAGSAYSRYSRDASTGLLSSLGGEISHTAPLLRAAQFADNFQLVVLSAPNPGDPSTTSEVFVYQVETNGNMFVANIGNRIFGVAGAVDPEETAVIAGAKDMLVSPDGRHIYVAATEFPNGGGPNYVARFDRNTATGSVSFGGQLSVPDVPGIREISLQQNNLFISGIASNANKLVRSLRDPVNGHLSGNSVITGKDYALRLSSNLFLNGPVATPDNQQLIVHDGGSTIAIYEPNREFPFADSLFGTEDGARLNLISDVIVGTNNKSLYATSEGMTSGLASGIIRFSRSSNGTTYSVSQVTGFYVGRDIVLSSDSGPENGVAIMTSTSDNNFTFVERILTYDIDAATGALSENQTLAAYEDAPIQRTGYRAIAGTGDGKFLAAISDNDNNLQFFKGGLNPTVTGDIMILGGTQALQGVIDVAIASGVSETRAFVVSPDVRSLASYTLDTLGNVGRDKYRQDDPNLAGATAIAVSPDGASVYVSTPAGVQAFSVGSTFFFPIDNEAVANAVDVHVNPDGKHVYVAGANNQLHVFTRANDGLLTPLQVLTNGVGGVNGLGGISRIASSADGSDIYVTGSTDDAVAHFRKNAGTGLLEFKGVNSAALGLVRLDGANGVTVSADGKFVYVSSSTTSTVSAFARDAGTGSLTFRQAVSNNAGGVSGMDAPTDIHAEAGVIYLTSATNGGGLVTLAENSSVPPPVVSKYSWSNFELLDANGNAGDDYFRIAKAPTVVTDIAVAQGDDTIIIASAPPTLDLSLGIGANLVVYNSANAGVTMTTSVNNANGSVDYRVHQVGASSSLTLEGSNNADSFTITAGRIALGSTVSVVGDAGVDSLSYDPTGFAFSPALLPAGNATVTIANRGTLTYQSIENPVAIAPPVIAANSVTITEGSALSVTMTATNSPTSWAWDFNGDGKFGEVTGATINVNWASLVTFGLGDNGRYVIPVQATNAQGTSEGELTLVVRNARPNRSLSSSAVTVGSVTTVTISGPPDPGSDSIERYWITWGDGTVEEFGPGTTSATHAYAVPGSYRVGLIYEDEDGVWADGGIARLDANGIPNQYYSLTPASDFLTARTAAQKAGGQLLTINGATEERAIANGFLTSNQRAWLGYTDEVTEGKFVWSSGQTPAYSNWAPGQPDDFGGGQDYAVIQRTGDDSDGNPTVQWDDVTNAGFSIPGIIEFDSIPASFGNLVVAVNPPTSLGETFSVAEGDDLTLTVPPSLGGNVADMKWSLVIGATTTTLGTGLSITVPWSQLRTAGADNGVASTIIAEVTYSSGTFKLAGGTLTVTNTAPTIDLAGLAFASEGVSYALSLSASDFGNDTVSSWKVDWGNGKVSNSGSAAPTLTQTYADNGTYTVTITATDEDGTTELVFPLEVVNVAPVARHRGVLSTTQYATYVLDLSTVDVATDTITSWTINWGDGVIETIAGNPSTASHQYAAAGTYTVTAQVTDEDGTHDAVPSLSAGDHYWSPGLGGNGRFYSLTATAQPFNIARFDALSLVPGGSLVTIDDANENAFLASRFAGANYWIGLTDEATEGAFRWLSSPAAVPSFFNWQAGQPSGSTPGEDFVEILLSDPAGAAFGQWNDRATVSRRGIVESAVAANVTVLPARREPPTLSLTGAPTTNEGTAYNLTLSATTGAKLDVISHWTVNWGDGQVSIHPGSTPVVAAHVYADGTQSFNITAIAHGADADYFATAVPITVLDVAGVYSIAGSASGTEGAPYKLNLADADPGVDSVNQWTIDWGNGTIISYSGDPAFVDYTYPDSGNYTITAKVSTGELSAIIVPGSVGVAVADVAPRPLIGGVAKSQPNVAYRLNLGSFDPGQDPITQWQINWGDGNSEMILGDPSAATHVYTALGMFTITAQVVNDDGTFAALNSVDVEVTNAAPPHVVITGVPTTAVEGTTITLGQSVTGTGGYTFQWQVRRQGDAIFDPLNNTVTDVIYAQGSGSTFAFTPNDNGSYNVRLVVVDGMNLFGFDGVDITVANVAPTASFTADGPAAPTAPLTVRFTDGQDVSSVDLAAGLRYSFDFNNDGDFDDFGDLNFVAASSASFAFPTFGTYVVRGRVWDLDGGFTDSTTSVSVVGPMFAVTSMKVNDGSAQRSRVTSLTVTFNRAIGETDAGAFQLVRISGSGGVPTLTPTIAPDGLSVLLTFSGAGLEFASLTDGRYRLEVDGSKVRDQFLQPLDGDANGSVGGTYQGQFHRLFGDADGNGQVTSGDFLAFRVAFLSTYPAFDFDGNGSVDSGDFLQFRLRFLQSV